MAPKRHYTIIRDTNYHVIHFDFKKTNQQIFDISETKQYSDVSITFINQQVLKWSKIDFFGSQKILNFLFIVT